MFVLGRPKNPVLAAILFASVSAAAYELTSVNYTFSLDHAYAWVQYNDPTLPPDVKHSNPSPSEYEPFRSKTHWHYSNQTDSNDNNAPICWIDDTDGRDLPSFTFTFFGSSFCVYGEVPDPERIEAFQWGREFERKGNISMLHGEGNSSCGYLQENREHRVEVVGIYSVDNITVTAAIPAPPQYVGSL
jgi:hypothetical protein